MKTFSLVAMMIMLVLLQADNRQENLVTAKANKLEADGLVNFITVNEIRYITEYNQVVGPTKFFITIMKLLPSVCQTLSPVLTK